MSFVYILESINTRTYYVGCTNDLVERLKKHNSGKVFWTKIRLPWRLIYNERYELLSQARQREKQIKSWKKREMIERLIAESTI